MWTESSAEAVPQLEGAQHKAGIARCLGACPSPPGPMRPCPHKLQIKASTSH